MQIEFDPAKAAKNLAKHGVDLLAAARVLSDPDHIDKLDARRDHGEARHIAIGMVERRLLVLVYTRRGRDLIRLISGRKANVREEQTYGQNRP